jgi:peptide-N4-(N-acetyl-beta-glucosaminyl)asparagine amidase
MKADSKTRDPQFATTVKESIGEVWDDLDGRIEVLQREPPFEPFGEEEAIVLGMSQWFKYDFMTWVDPIKCPKCQGETRFSGMAAPTQQEKAMGGDRVESHRCVVCQTERRFMRLNEPRSLLKTREGRCGESPSWLDLMGRRIRSALLCSTASKRASCEIYLEQ